MKQYIIIVDFSLIYRLETKDKYIINLVTSLHRNYDHLTHEQMRAITDLESLGASLILDDTDHEASRLPIKIDGDCTLILTGKI